MFHDHSPRAISEQDAAATVRPVHQLGQHLTANDQGIFRQSRPQIGIRGIQCKQETGTGRIHIESQCIHRADGCLYLTGTAGQILLRRTGCHQDQADFFRRYSRLFQCFAGCF